MKAITVILLSIIKLFSLSIAALTVAFWLVLPLFGVSVILSTTQSVVTIAIVVYNVTDFFLRSLE
jgi:hypothetical protein